MLGALPPRVRDLYGLRYTPAHEVAFRSAVTTLRGALRYSPRAIRKGENAGFFDLVARTERAMILGGKPVPGALGTLGAEASATS
jgi:uncharacterized protein (DUF2236 family)